MNIQQLKYVMEISNSASMRDAATRLYVSQPALSSSIKDLEDELGILIFDRSNRGIKLTDEGREFLSHAKNILVQYEILEDRYYSKNKDKEHFSVSTQHYNFAIKAFTNIVKKHNPEKYIFHIHETKTQDVLEDVKNMKSEVGVISFSSSNEKVMRKLFKEYKLHFTALMKKETYVYLWKSHVLAKRDELSLSELSDYPCISFDQSSDSKFYLTEEAMSDYHFEKLIKSDDRATTMELIANLNGYSIGSGMLSGDDAVLKGLVSIKLKEEDPLTIGYITRNANDLSDYGKEYIDELLKYKDV